MTSTSFILWAIFRYTFGISWEPFLNGPRVAFDPRAVVWTPQMYMNEYGMNKGFLILNTGSSWYDHTEEAKVKPESLNRSYFFKPWSIFSICSGRIMPSRTPPVEDTPIGGDDADADEIMERIVRSATQGPAQPRERRRSRANRKSCKTWTWTSVHKLNQILILASVITQKAAFINARIQSVDHFYNEVLLRSYSCIMSFKQ